ncbi:MAG: polyhydroxyalkanoate biosynthesis repressor PhaR, partial [Rhizobacter sp.]|nr:polyhydroxyalkanoate biosynthesis repressor PhaR [Rhizobacter sp.]
MVSPRRGSAAAHGTNGVESASKGTARHRSTDRATAIEAEVADAGAAAAPAAGTGKGGAPAGDSSPQRILKKYPNRRLYDTRHSTYITLADVKQMVLEGQDFVVRDAKTSDDLTRSILLQIILEEETGGVPLFSSQMLAQLIRFYG